MSKKKQAKKSSRRRDDESIVIAIAERKLAKAIAEANEALEKVARREQKLARLLVRYGRDVPESDSTDAAIPLEAPSQEASENGVDQDSETSDELVDIDAVEQH